MDQERNIMNRTGKPRVIRRVVKKDRTGRPKVARDRKTQIQMERVTARSSRPCAASGCPKWRVLILPDEAYAKVTYAAEARRMGSHLIPKVKDFHFECVPPEAQPLVRFLVSRNEGS